ncbi:unnamed protein product [Meganyctiphanes norvegica]|uniref:Elongator complex protein 1 n=1 Tax=Meganyctiphanes norvegica TaxID=48144 RepID=A0AAV2S5H0_MEGNR
MRNLYLSNQSSVEVASPDGGFVCLDAVTGATYHIDSKGCRIIRNSNVYEEKPDIEWQTHDISGSSIICADAVIVINAICVVTKDGDVITVNTDTHEVEVVGSVGDGLEAACWSPDQELLVLVTTTSNVVIMTAQFDPVTEFPLNQEDFGESKFINVGWGKKETQFHGTEGKTAAKKVKASTKPVTEWDDCKPRISWRGDGQHFAVSYVTQETNIRCLRVVNREGVLQATSEELDGLEQSLSWRPSGNLIATSQRFPNKHDIIFFEKNGLKHGDFSLPFKPSEMVVKEVEWNQDSNVLMVWLQPLSSTSEKDITVKNIVQLWTIGNYHWYLKKQLSFEETVHQVSWDTEFPLKLHIFCASGLQEYSWVFITNFSRGIGLGDLAQVAVIDGAKVKITPFREAVVPPPISAYEVTFPNEVDVVLFAPPVSFSTSPETSICVEDSGFLETFDPPGNNSNNICVLHDNCTTLTILTQAFPNDNLNEFDCGVIVSGAGGNGYMVKVHVHRVLTQCKIEWDVDDMPAIDLKLFCNWVWASTDKLIASYKNSEGNYIAILELERPGGESGIMSPVVCRGRVAVKSVIPVEEEIVSIAPSQDGTVIALQRVSGALLKLDIMELTVMPWEEEGEEIVFPSVCQQVALCPIDEGAKLIPLGLSARNRLYWASHQLMANCSSFHIHSDHLLVTTASHQLQIIPLFLRAFQALAEGKTDTTGIVGTRKVERGSRLVSAVVQDTRVILQMPRGNLEVVSPRPLAVHTLKMLLKEHKYHQALDIMRKQRVDMNLVYDHDPQDFINNVKLFVESVDNAHWIDLFIANLNEVDVTKSMYAFNYYDRIAHSSQVLNSKVDCVCNAVRTAMLEVDEEKFLLPILTSYVKMTKSQMDVALQKVQEMKEEKKKKYTVSAEEGLRHLLYIADANELYDVALGTYNFELVMMIAEKSQKDPKEYLPFLNELKKMEENYRKFKINIHLRKFRKAIESIKDCSDNHMEECLALIKSEKLFRDALEIFSLTSSMNKNVCEAYGDYLTGKSYHNEAAMMYIRADKLEDSLYAYKQAANWKKCLIVASRLKWEKENMNELCNELVETLKDKTQYADAAMIYEEYLKNEEEAVECLVKGCLWDDAQRIAYKHSRPDLVDTNIKPGANEQHQFYSSEIERISKEFKDNLTRLAVVRQNKEREHLDLLEGKGEEQLDADLYSDTSTVTGMSYSRSNATRSQTGSAASTRTYRSSKNRRKLERKKYSTKEGSAFEDLGLMAALHELMTSADQMTVPVSQLMTALLTFGYDAKATQLQSSLSDILTLMDHKKQEIWPGSETTEEDQQDEFGPQCTTEGAVRQLIGGQQNTVSLLQQRMRTLEPHLRHAPPPTRTPNWILQSLKGGKR